MEIQMHSLFKNLLILLTLACSTLASPLVTSIENPSFESDWRAWKDRDPSALSGEAHTGRKSVKITGANGRVEQMISVEPNTHYVLSAWVKGAGIIGVEGNGLHLKKGGAFSLWSKLSVDFFSGSVATVNIFAAYNGASGRFDDFMLTKASGPVTPSPSPSQLPSAKPTPIMSPTIAPVTSRLEAVSVTASSDDGNIAINTIDGSLSTRWSAKGKGQSITYDLGSVQLLSEIRLAFYKGAQRRANFEVFAGPNISNLSAIYVGTSSGASDTLEAYDLVDSPAQFVKIVGQGNSQNAWTSITELELYGGGDIHNLTPVAQINAPTAAPIDTLVTFDGATSYDPDGGSIVNYAWQFSNGVTAAGATIKQRFSTAGNYTVSLVVTDDEGQSHRTAQTITIDDDKKPPVANITASASAEPSSMLTIDASDSFDPDGGKLVSYAWDFGDGTVANTVSVQKSYSSEGVFIIQLTVTDDEGKSSTASTSIRISSISAEQALWPLVNASFELSSSTGGWLEDDPAGVVSTNGTSNPKPPEGGRLLVINGNGGLIKQALYKPIAGHIYEASAWVYGHGSIGIQDLGSDAVFENTTNHGASWRQLSVTFVSTGSPAMVYAKYGNGSGKAYFDVFNARDISTAEDLAKPLPQKIMRYPSQVIDLSAWKITLPINKAMELYNPELLTYSIDPWFKLVEDQDGHAIQFRANHGGILRAAHPTQEAN